MIRAISVCALKLVFIADIPEFIAEDAQARGFPLEVHSGELPYMTQDCEISKPSANKS